MPDSFRIADNNPTLRLQGAFTNLSVVRSPVLVLVVGRRGVEPLTIRHNPL
jgi:hypothetical protein